MPRRQHQATASLLLSLWALGAMLSSGCSPSAPQLAEVSGLLTLDGEPLPFKSVTFMPIDGNQSNGAGGFSDQQGRYRLKAYVPGSIEDHDGCPPGEYRVVVEEPIFPISAADFEERLDSPTDSFIELPARPMTAAEFEDAEAIASRRSRPATGVYRLNTPSSIPSIYRSAEQSPLTLIVPVEGGSLDISLHSPTE